MGHWQDLWNILSCSFIKLLLWVYSSYRTHAAFWFQSLPAQGSKPSWQSGMCNYLFWASEGRFVRQAPQALGGPAPRLLSSEDIFEVILVTSSWDNFIPFPHCSWGVGLKMTDRRPLAPGPRPLPPPTPPPHPTARLAGHTPGHGIPSCSAALARPTFQNPPLTEGSQPVASPRSLFIASSASECLLSPDPVNATHAPHNL